MQKKMNMQKNCMECCSHGYGEQHFDPVDNAMKMIEKSEYLMRNIQVDLLDATRLLLEEAIKESDLEEEVSVVLLMDGGEECSIVTEYEVEEKYPEKEFSGVAVIYDEMLIASFDPDDVVTLGDVEYLVGPMLIHEMDENGNETGICRQTIVNAVDYASCCDVEIQVEDQSFPAFILM